MKRVAFLSSCSLPFHLRYWMNFLPNWIDEVDEIILNLQQIPIKYKKYIVEKAKKYKKLKVIEEPVNPWPQSITDAIRNTETESVLILHDDTFILRPGVVDKYFKLVEEGNVVTPLHGIYSPTEYVNQTLKEMYGKYLEGFNDFSFLLYFLFMPRRYFLGTSGYLGGSGWKKGEFVELFGRILETDVAGDTGFKLGLELFVQKVPFVTIPQQTTADIQFSKFPLKKLQETSFPDGWVHFQNMANTLPDWFDGSHGWRNIQNKEDLVMKSFMAMRLGLMQEFLDVDDYDEIIEDALAAELEIADIGEAFKINSDEVDEYQKEIRRILCVV